jgi:hypothetical protein
MSLSRHEVNPLSVLNVRRLKFIPKHFATTNIGPYNDIKFINHWINFNLNSRYAIIKNHHLDSENKISESIIVGLEDPKEITIFLIACPILQK